MPSPERGNAPRLQSGKACSNCRKRKQRCDGLQPQCGGCRSRGASCSYSSSDQAVITGSLDLLPTVPSDPGDTAPSPTIHVHASTASGRNRNARLSETSVASPVVLPGDTIQLGQTHAVSLATIGEEDAIPAPPSRLSLQLQSADVTQQPGGYFGESSTYDFVSRIRSASPRADRVRDSSKRRRISSPHGFGMTGSILTPPSSTAASPVELPDRALADRLLDAYFHRVHRLCPFVHEGAFRSEYEKMWARHSGSGCRPAWLALLNMVFFFGWEYSNPSESNEPDGAFVFANRAQSLLYVEMLAEANLEIVQALLLVSHFLQGTLQINKCWSLAGLMTHAAISIGLHLDPAPMALTSIEKEIRKRVWWGCMLLGCTLGLKFGRPPIVGITDGFLVDYPAEVDDQYIGADSIIPRQPIGRPSMTSLFVQTVKLTPIMERILKDLYHNGATKRFANNIEYASAPGPTPAQTLGATVTLDGQLSEWLRTAPRHLTGQSQGEDHNDSTFDRQRFVLLIRYHYVRLLLHRQAFLIFSRQQVEDPFLTSVAAASAQTCIASATQSIQLICSPESRWKLTSLYYTLHYIFAATGVLLSLKTRDTARFEAIGLMQDNETLNLGMDFLKSASHTVPLAAQYYSMLRQIQIQAGSARPEHVRGGSGADATVLTPNITDTTSPLANHVDVVDDQGVRLGGLFDMNAMFDMDFLDSDDLFMSTGL